MDTCASRICKAMQIRNMRQVDLSIKTGIPKSAISQYCSGSFSPKQKRLFLIAQALNVDEAWLMGLDVPMERQPDAAAPIFNLSAAEQDLIRKFRQLDERGKAAVMNSLEHEYAALPQEDAHNVLRIAARDGSYQEVTLTDQQAADLQSLLEQLPDVPSGL